MEHQPCNLLMVGSSYDSALWDHCTQGNITYLETNTSFLPLIPANAVICQFDSKVGEWRPVPEPPPQDAQRRFQLVVRRFIGVFARSDHPLTLFLDDLQWLDAATLISSTIF